METPIWHPSSLDTIHTPSECYTEKLASCCRLAQWSFDGHSFLQVSEDCTTGLYVAERAEGMSAAQRFRKSTLKHAAPILGAAWYPSATPLRHETYCFVASIRGEPVKLLDAADGRLRASYKIIDHRERFIAPHSMTFNLAGTRMFCGFTDAIEVFDVSAPGEGARLFTRPTKKSKDGLRGIISSLAFCPDYSGLYAAGTFSSSIGLLSEETGEDILVYLDDVPGPVTQLQFHPTRQSILFAACRQTNEIALWDVRNTSSRFHTFARESMSNQRMHFDVDAAGHWLAAGTTDGYVNFYDTQTLSQAEPVSRFKLHNDAVSTVKFRPLEPHLLTVSGARHFVAPEESDSDSGSDLVANDENAKSQMRIAIRDSSIKLSDLSGSSVH